MTPRPSPEAAALALRARGLGCRPVWHDGILGWAFHCTCPGNPHGVDQQCSVITEESIARRALVTTPRDGGSCCDPAALFGSVFGPDPPRGVDFVDTTFTVPGEVQSFGCPLHGIGCPSHCPVLRAAIEAGR